MKTWNLWLSSAFAGAILLLAAAAGWRAAPRDAAGPGAGARWWNGAVTREFESHYDAVFPTRALGINAWAAIGYVLFREGKPGVVVGRDGWLYTAEEFDAAPDAAAQVDAHLALVGSVRELLAARHSALLVALVPAKARVRPEPLGARLPPPAHQALYARALAGVQRQQIPAPDLLAALSACRRRGPPAEPMFLRTDTHWTPAGARCAAESLAGAARGAGLATPRPGAYRTVVGGAVPHRGDLLAFLPLEPWFEGLLPPPDALAVHRTEPLAASAGLLDDVAAPAVTLVGTSYSADARWNFAGALRQALGEDVVSYAAPAHGPFAPMLEYLDSPDFASAPPRLVIWEMPERYLPMRDGDGPSAPPAPGNPA